MELNIIIWLMGIIAFVILEAITYQMVSIWFALGAVGGLIAAIIGIRFNIQMTVFLVISVLLLLCLRPVSKRLLKTKQEKTNADSLIGKEVVITKEVDNLQGKGEGKINGMTWSVRSADNSCIPENETVTVEDIKGVKLIVKRKGE